MHAPVIDSAPARATMASFGRDAGLVSSDRTSEQVSFRALIGMPSHRRYLHASRTPCQESSSWTSVVGSKRYADLAHQICRSNSAKTHPAGDDCSPAWSRRSSRPGYSSPRTSGSRSRSSCPVRMVGKERSRLVRQAPRRQVCKAIRETHHQRPEGSGEQRCQACRWHGVTGIGRDVRPVPHRLLVSWDRHRVDPCCLATGGKIAGARRHDQQECGRRKEGHHVCGGDAEQQAVQELRDGAARTI